jgi:hypothetical protein
MKRMYDISPLVASLPRFLEFLFVVESQFLPDLPRQNSPLFASYISNAISLPLFPFVKKSPKFSAIFTP